MCPVLWSILWVIRVCYQYVTHHISFDNQERDCNWRRALQTCLSNDISFFNLHWHGLNTCCLSIQLSQACYTGVVMTLSAQFGDGSTFDIGCATVPGERKEEYDWVARKFQHFVRKLLVCTTTPHTHQCRVVKPSPMGYIQQHRTSQDTWISQTEIKESPISLNISNVGTPNALFI